MENPVNKQVREKLAGIDRRFPEAFDLLQKCKACQMDVGDREQVLAFLAHKAQLIKEQFLGAKPQKSV